MQFQWPPSAARLQRESLGQPISLVVDDSVEIQQQLTGVLRQAFSAGSVLVTAQMRDAVQALVAHPVDIALIDLELADGSGIDLIRECHRVSPLTRCVVTTSYDDDDHLAAALSAGALGYLLKNQPEILLIQQLRLLGDGIPPLSPSIARRLVAHFAQRNAAVSKPIPSRQHRAARDVIALSERETQVLTLIAKGMQIADVAQLLEITANTACSHIKNIYRKRQLSSRAEAALEAQRLGLV